MSQIPVDMPHIRKNDEESGLSAEIRDRAVKIILGQDVEYCFTLLNEEKKRELELAGDWLSLTMRGPAAQKNLLCEEIASLLRDADKTGALFQYAGQIGKCERTETMWVSSELLQKMQSKLTPAEKVKNSRAPVESAVLSSIHSANLDPTSSIEV